MCWNPSRWVYTVLFPHLNPLFSSSLSICLHPLAQLLVSASIFFFFFVSVPWLPCGHSVRWVCLSPLAICFPDKDENWSSVQTYIYTHINTFFSPHKHKCTLVLKTVIWKTVEKYINVISKKKIFKTPLTRYKVLYFRGFFSILVFYNCSW